MKIPLGQVLRFTVIAAVLVGFLLGNHTLPASAASATLAGSFFEGSDGNMSLDGGSSFKDWINAPGIITANDKFPGATDDTFGSGAKEDSVIPGLATGTAPNKEDLSRFYLSTEQAVYGGSTQTYIYLGWERLAATGAANIDFEINQAGGSTYTGTNANLVRTDGDMLIQYDFSGSGTPTFTLWRWATAGSPNFVGGCLSNPAPPCWSNRQLLNASTLAIGGVNTAPVPDLVQSPTATCSASGTGTNCLGTNSFGEAAVNISSIFKAGSCTSFGSAWVKGRSSSSPSAELKDYIAPVPVFVSNCGKLVITKQDDTGAALAGATFGLYPGANVTNFGTPAAGTCTSDATGTCTIASIALPSGQTSGQFTLHETSVPSGYSAAPDQNVTISSDLSTSVTINDPRLKASVTITKKDDAGNALAGAGFTLYTDTNGNSQIDSGEGVTSGATNNPCTTAVSNGSATCTISGIVPASGTSGKYCLRETTVPAGYTAAADQCFSVDVTKTTSYSASFTDTRQPGTLTIQKQDDTQAVLGNAVFTLYVDTNGNGGYDAGTDQVVKDSNNNNVTCTTSSSTGQCAFSNLTAGKYCAVESTTPAGYQTAAPLCATIALAGAVTLTFTDNRQPASITITKTDDAGNALAGAGFTLYTDTNGNGAYDPGTDTIASGATNNPCTTATGATTSATCSITNILPAGKYCVVETTTPSGYLTAAPQCVTLALGDSRSLSFIDTRSTASVTITKKDDAGNALAGAGFTLYTDTNGNSQIDSGEGVTSGATNNPCTTAVSNGNATCTISGIVPASGTSGKYCLRETTVPAGYTAAADQCFSVDVTKTTSYSASFTDTRKPATISITKTDDVGAALAGATFTLYADNKDNSGNYGTFGSEDTPIKDGSNNVTCTTALVSGTATCSITNILPAGNYCLAETGTPPGYQTAPAQCVTLALGDNQTLSFTDARKFKVITIVCQDSNNSLYPSSVTLDGSTATSLNATDAQAAGLTTSQVTQICGLNKGATFDGKSASTTPYAGSVTIPK